MIWSNEYGTPRRDLEGPSPVEAALLLLGPYGLGTLAVLQLMSGTTRLVSVAALLVMGVRVAWLYLRPLGRRRVRVLKLAPGGRIQIRFADGRSSGAWLLQGVVLPGVSLLVLVSRRGAVALVLPHYRISPADRRWLRCWLRHGQGAHASGSTPSGVFRWLTGGALAQVAERSRRVRGERRGSG